MSRTSCHRLASASNSFVEADALMRSMPNVPEEMQRAVVYAQWHMVVGWAVVAPIVTLVIGALASSVLKKKYGRAMA